MRDCKISFLSLGKSGLILAQHLILSRPPLKSENEMGGKRKEREREKEKERENFVCPAVFFYRMSLQTHRNPSKQSF